jgi:nucleotide-binding universal stress UspA family protein
VPCDFSKPAVNAFRYACDLAAKAKAAVHLINVIELPVLHDTVLMPVLSFEAALMEDLKGKTEKQFRKLNEKYTIEGVKVVFALEFGPVSRSILEYVKKNGIDLIVMGSHGSSGLREVVIGSNAAKLVRKSPVPVLVVKSYSKGAIRSIVFPNTLDTEDQDDLVAKVKELQEFFKAKLHIVHINTPLNFTSDDVTFARLKAFAKQFNFRNHSLNVYNHSDGEEGILRFTDKVKGDLIALGTHGRTGLAHLVNGSLAEDIANHTDRLIWTYSLKNEPGQKVS